MVPPFEGVPADEAPCRAPVADFDFKRLGNRVILPLYSICQNSACRDLKLTTLILPQLTSLLISPWVSNGSAVQEPKGPTKTSQFELSSVPATVKTLFNLTSFLTKRDA